MPLKETIGALCKMKRDGLTRHIGVSNFNPALVAEAVKLATEPLVNNQIELHPYNDQSKTIAASRKAGLSVTFAYSPISAAAASRAMRCCRGSARRTAGPRQQPSACAIWCSRTSS